MNLKRLIATGVLTVGVLGAGAVAYAAGNVTPAQIAADLTGQTVEAVTAERAAGDTYGTIASEAGQLPEFQQKMLELRKANLDQRVKDGQLTQEQADQLYQTMQANQANCTGTGAAGIGKQAGAGLGCGGNGQGLGQGQGQGGGMMRGLGGGGMGRGRVR